MDNLTKGLIAVGALAGVGIVIYAVVALSKPKSGYPAHGKRGTLTLSSAAPADTGEGIENYSEVVWTDALGNERRMTARRVVKPVR